MNPLRFRKIKPVIQTTNMVWNIRKKTARKKKHTFYRLYIQCDIVFICRFLLSSISLTQQFILIFGPEKMHAKKNLCNFALRTCALLCTNIYVCVRWILHGFFFQIVIKIYRQLGLGVFLRQPQVFSKVHRQYYTAECNFHCVTITIKWCNLILCFRFE